MRLIVFDTILVKKFDTTIHLISRENERYLKTGCSLLPRQAVLVSLLNFIYGDCDKWSWLTSECFSIIYGDPKTTDLGGSCMTPSNYDFDRGCFVPALSACYQVKKETLMNMFLILGIFKL